MRWNSDKCCIEYFLKDLNSNNLGWHVADCFISQDYRGCNTDESVVSGIYLNDTDYADEIEINLGDDYEYKFEMNRLYILKKKPKYPVTYKECCDVLNLSWNKCFVMFDIDHNGLTDEENNLYESLIKLKRCRDAYWKIAGEQMRLGKSWEPD